jgi:hypothetical protein
VVKIHNVDGKLASNPLVWVHSESPLSLKFGEPGWGWGVGGVRSWRCGGENPNVNGRATCIRS